MILRTLRSILPALALIPAVAGAEQPDFYVGAAWSKVDYKTQVPPHAALASSYEINNTRDRFKVFAGMRPWQHFGFELSYADLGRYRDQQTVSAPIVSVFVVDVDAKVRSGSAYAVGFLPFHRFDFFAKGGVVYVQQQVKTTTTDFCQQPVVCIQTFPASTEITVRDHTTRFASGAGFQVGGQHLALRAEYERFFIDEHASLLSLGLTWSF